ncbi:GLPGLI family protein [Pedobacter sp. ASV1-7]|uniref:GLPGLI family protein n=1 Tax=Pedobacter sp. ASV1-7 TaxID=3145237 RepID=UPI0032E85486
MKLVPLISFLLSVMCFNLRAQETFIPYGKITFEKKVNLIRSLENSNIPTEAMEGIKKYVVSTWEFYFTQSKSLYRQEKKDVEDNNPAFLTFSNSKLNNEIYTDYSNNKRVIKRSIMDENYLLTDTIPKLNWKIMHDIRNIAGYECRKAVGVIYDTVYVVAFYTDEILLRGGPEGFSGLPGTILGLAIPRYNTTWFATKVNGFENHASKIVPAVKGKNIETTKDLDKLIELFTRYDQNKKEKAEEAKRKLYGFTL